MQSIVGQNNGFLMTLKAHKKIEEIIEDIEIEFYWIRKGVI